MNNEILQMFKNYCLIFDIVRIVDPLKEKIILSNKEKQIEEKKRTCLELWNKKGIYINPTSFKSYNERKTFMKIEYLGDRVYWCMSVPMEIDDKVLIFELIKDITDELCIENNTIEMKKEMERINRLTVTDELTGAYNRRYINEILPLEIIDSSIHDRTITIAIMDIDYFKNINDTYGHLAGDYILKEVVKIIRKNIRSIDSIARYGGEEFIIIFNHNKCEDILKVIERIRKKIEEYDFIFDGIKINVSASFGVEGIGENESVETLLERADKKLYEAKRNGRNRVIG